MASSISEYLVVIPDFANVPPEVRAEARPIHLREIQPLVDAKVVVMGGALLSRVPQPGEPPAVNGSVMMVQMESADAVRQRLESDVYHKKAIWDLDKAQIILIKCGFRTPL
ncbi:uncharacterized protein PV07_02218 [Cladophialophora immunda]|uniref:YCII-related domain-containing protein n=1 Tax=Cladophialophora immunda TaxID=569365 RepID=A0A0D2CWT5_9EURO|nr:uncharacterized protein PV07_02218 [Cladophialophora immunda]KIW35528.1 hypothetical protein PV07_02218 [Cladophialophora immunda]OQV09734.1 hypothetical protein CLAIMM_13824 [Cladophialophora immunda]